MSTAGIVVGTANGNGDGATTGHADGWVIDGAEGSGVGAGAGAGAGMAVGPTVGGGTGDCVGVSVGSRVGTVETWKVRKYEYENEFTAPTAAARRTSKQETSERRMLHAREYMERLNVGMDMEAGRIFGRLLPPRLWTVTDSNEFKIFTVEVTLTLNSV